MSRIYKILPRTDWAAAEAAGVFHGSPLDLKDGYIHFSTAAQAGETARRHFHGQDGLVIVGFEVETLARALGEALRWEPSRGGDLFPHLYAPLPTSLSVSLDPLPLDAHGAPIPPDLAP